MKKIRKRQWDYEKKKKDEEQIIIVKEIMKRWKGNTKKMKLKWKERVKKWKKIMWEN